MAISRFASLSHAPRLEPYLTFIAVDSTTLSDITGVSSQSRLTYDYFLHNGDYDSTDSTLERLCDVQGRYGTGRGRVRTLPTRTARSGKRP